jgi:hypothetical protein
VIYGRATFLETAAGSPKLDLLQGTLDPQNGIRSCVGTPPAWRRSSGESPGYTKPDIIAPDVWKIIPAVAIG